MKPITLAIIEAGRGDSTKLLILANKLLRTYDENRLLLFAINRLHLKPRRAYDLLRDALYKIH
jgi:hypothetical protein